MLPHHNRGVLAGVRVRRVDGPQIARVQGVVGLALMEIRLRRLPRLRDRVSYQLLELPHSQEERRLLATGVHFDDAGALLALQVSSRCSRQQSQVEPPSRLVIVIIVKAPGLAPRRLHGGARRRRRIRRGRASEAVAEAAAAPAPRARLARRGEGRGVRRGRGLLGGHRFVVAFAARRQRLNFEGDVINAYGPSCCAQSMRRGRIDA